MIERAVPQSLRSRLIRRLVPFQAALAALLTILVVGALFATGVLLSERDEDLVIDVVAQALTRDKAGDLVVNPTPALEKLRSEIPQLWFLIRDRQGHTVSEGQVPPEFAKIGGALDDIGQARLGWQMFDDDPRIPAARMKRMSSGAGTVMITTASQGPMPFSKAMLAILTAFAVFALPSFLLMTLATVLATPAVVRRALAGLDAAAERARQIDIGSRGARLPLHDVPAEIAPLVGAVNDALTRLDDGYLRHKRFIADAAHELRTPIAILTTRLEALPDLPEKTRLLNDAARLSNLAEQLLDIQRLDQTRTSFERVDLVGLGRQVAADLAPLAIAAGYQLEFTTDAERIEVLGDQAALERAVTNLAQNAIQHAGRRGTITIKTTRPATVEVSDQGDGIPADQRGLIFEPFHRLRPLDRGAGLGLNLVREIIELHQGRVAVVDRAEGGACFSISLPPAAVTASLR